jgi:hypothetical protein
MKLAAPAKPPATDVPAMTVQPASPARHDSHDTNETTVAAMSLPRPPLPPPLKAAPANIPAPKPAPRPAEPTESDMQSVLARLRQSGPSQAAAPAPAQPNQQATRAPDRAARPADQPALPRLTAARAALGAGRMDDAVRLLQEAQLQLVFRPVDTSAANPEGIGQGASDVARALEALSGNNVPNGMRFIDQAIGDLNGNRTNSPAALSDLRSTGYAPAYPPR